MKNFYRILAALLVFAAIIWIYLKAEIIFIYLIIAAIIAYLLNPFVDFLQKAKIHRGLAILIVYCELFLILGILGFLFLPTLILEVKEAAGNLPAHFDNLKNYSLGLVEKYPKNYYLNQFKLQLKELQEMPFLANFFLNTQKFALKILAWTGQILFGLFITLIIAFYLLLDAKKLKKWFLKFLPHSYRADAEIILGRINEKLALYVQVQFLICLLVAGWNILILMILGINYAFVIGLLVGLASIVPVLGSIFGVAVNLFFGLLNSFWKALGAIAGYLFIQALTDHIIYPQLIGRSVKIHPLLVLLAVLIGAKIFGPVGILIAVPILVVAGEFFIFLREKSFKENE